MKAYLKIIGKGLGCLALWLGVSAALVIWMDVPAVLGAVYAVPLLAAVVLAVRLVTGIRTALQWLRKSLRGVWDWVLGNGKRVVRMTLPLLMTAALCFLYWTHAEWKVLWTALFLYLGWTVFSRLLDKL